MGRISPPRSFSFAPWRRLDSGAIEGGVEVGCRARIRASVLGDLLPDFPATPFAQAVSEDPAGDDSRGQPAPNCLRPDLLVDPERKQEGKTPGAFLMADIMTHSAQCALPRGDKRRGRSV